MADRKQIGVGLVRQEDGNYSVRLRLLDALVEDLEIGC